ncbi:polyubiquitin 9-like [Megalobrama amblycephala]|uniref:polyubiquitin 9-like n=1 Tax=Megalobrama amblycephala TaxID=75352 RepID=UPI0020145467|nr:polyubiquitin 9-like [Megalobrama amblycephala]
MVFQVLIQFGSKEEKAIVVAESSEQFNNTTILEIKHKFISSTPGAPGPERLRVVLENKQLEDDKTFAFYNIEHLSVLTFVMRMPGGKDSFDSLRRMTCMKTSCHI